MLWFRSLVMGQSVPVEERGFSLVELMIGMVASVLVIGSLLSMTTQQANLRKVDQEIHLALLACRNNLEELRSLPIATLPAMRKVTAARSDGSLAICRRRVDRFRSRPR